MPQERVRSESYQEYEPSADVRLLYRWTMIHSQIGSTRDCGMILKLEKFSHLSSRSFGLSFPIRFGYLSLVLSLRADA